MCFSGKFCEIFKYTEERMLLDPHKLTFYDIRLSMVTTK